MRFRHKGLSERGDTDKTRFNSIYTNRIAQRTAEALEFNVHHISMFQAKSFAETETVGAKKVDVDVSGVAVRFKLEVMMLNILQAVAHFSFASPNLLGPQLAATAMNGDFARHGFKVRIEHKLGSDRAGVQF